MRSFVGFRGVCHVRDSSWDRDENSAGVQMAALSSHQLQLSAILLFQVLPWNNTPLLSLMEEYRHDGHELHSYYTDLLCSPKLNNTLFTSQVWSCFCDFAWLWWWKRLFVHTALFYKSHMRWLLWEEQKNRNGCSEGWCVQLKTYLRTWTQM